MVVVVIDVVFVKKLLQSGVGSMQEFNERHLPLKAPLKIMGTKFFGKKIWLLKFKSKKILVKIDSVIAEIILI